MACKILHIGVFFDGTGNNKENDRSKEAMSNIAKLSELYKNSDTWKDAEFEHKSVMIYKNGVGTTDGERHIVQDKYDKGGGGGGALRINQALKKVNQFLNDHPSGTDPGQYKERRVDVFGFSRGAAEARDFINTFYYNNKLWKEENVIFNFVGVYDTVGSFGIAGNNINLKPNDPTKQSESDTKSGELNNGYYGIVEHEGPQKVTQNFTAASEAERDRIVQQYESQGWKVHTSEPVGSSFYQVTCEKEEVLYEPYNFNLAGESAKKIVHMVAHDEVRKNFPLSAINLGGAHEEMMYPGVHSDIGGGYLPSETEPHSYDVGVYGSYFDAKMAADTEEKKLPHYWEVKRYSTGSRENEQHKVVAHWDRKISNALTTITLHRMHEIALENDVPFNPIPQDAVHQIPKEMSEFDTHTKANRMDAMSFNNIEVFKETYRHHSAVDPAEMDTHYDGHTRFFADVILKDSPDGGDGNDVRYVTAEDKVIDPRKIKATEPLFAKREIYPNNPSEAILPA